MTLHKNRSHKEIVGIQYLRGICAIGVVLDHTAAMASFSKYFDKKLFNGFLYTGALGVPLFFLISGFVISVVCLENKDGRLVTNISSLEFARRRFIRIVPLMWLAVLSYAFLRILGRSESYDAMPYIRGMLPLIPGDVDPKNVWTLRHEFIFYSVFALTFLGSQRRYWIIALWGIVPLAFALLSIPFEGGNFLHLLAVSIFNPVNIEFLAGLIIGIDYIKNRSGLVLPPPTNAFIILCFLFLIYMISGFMWGITLHGFHNAVLATALGVFILFLSAYIECNAGILNRLGLLLGDASYAIYLFHPHFVSAILGIWSHHLNNTPIVIVVFFTAFIAVCIGITIHLLVEKPLIKITKEYFSQTS